MRFQSIHRPPQQQCINRTKSRKAIETTATSPMREAQTRSINRTKSRKAIETWSFQAFSPLGESHVSTEPKAERQLRHMRSDAGSTPCGERINRTKSRKAIETRPCSPPYTPRVAGGVSTEPKAERQLRQLRHVLNRHDVHRINRTKSRKAIETTADASRRGRSYTRYQPNQKPKGN